MSLIVVQKKSQGYEQKFSDIFLEFITRKVYLCKCQSHKFSWEQPDQQDY
ncbi:hypothetical protein NIES22_43460 [Calothrix brevissima NIES-22]|nr:hypothetical protein NIES22_43460 [Calothrix brevissima NIES-22]